MRVRIKGYFKQTSRTKRWCSEARGVNEWSETFFQVFFFRYNELGIPEVFVNSKNLSGATVGSANEYALLSDVSPLLICAQSFILGFSSFVM